MVIRSLCLENILAEAPAIEAAALPPPQEADDLPLSEMAQRFPGRFECIFDTLLWWTPETDIAEQAAVELLHTDGLPLHCTVDPLPGAPAARSASALPALQSVLPSHAVRSRRGPS